MQDIHHLEDPSRFPKASTVHIASHQAAVLMLIFLPLPYFVLTPGASRAANTGEPCCSAPLAGLHAALLWESKKPLWNFPSPSFASNLFCILFFFLFFSRTTFCFYVLLSFHFLSQVAGTIDIHLHLIFLGLSLTHKYLLSLLALPTV